MKTSNFPSYNRTKVFETALRAARGDAAVEKAFKDIGLTGNEQPFMAKTWMAKYRALVALEPSIALSQQAQNALQSIVGSTARPSAVASSTVSPTGRVSKPLSPARPSQSAIPTRPVIDANLHGLDRVRASIRADMQAGTHGLQPLAADNDPWQLPASLASIPPVGRKIARLDVDQLGALACEVFGEVETNRLVSTSNSDAQTLNRLERQFFIENLTIPGQTDNAFNASLRMTNQTTGLAGVAHRRQQGKIDSFVAFLESES